MSNTIKKDNYKVPEYLKWMNEEEKLENQKIIKNMNKRIDYKRNPRYTNNHPTITFKSLMGRSGEMSPTEEQEEKEENKTQKESDG